VLDVWGMLLPLIIASALVPIQLTVTVLLLRSSLKGAAAWVGGITAARLVEAAIVIAAESTGVVASGGIASPPRWASILMVAAGALFYATAIRQLVRPVDIEAASPKWLKRAGDISTPALFGMGMAYLALSVKSSLINVVGIAAIVSTGAEGLRLAVGVLAFVALAEAGHLAILSTAAASPEKAAARLSALDTWLARNSRVIVVAIGGVFGTWFLAAGLRGLGVM